MKPLLTSEELIEHMKLKGITFNIISENEAKSFLKDNNYYMKLASYRENYPKYSSGNKEGQYINLDFAYLKELSTIDMHLRYHIIKMCLDIEHALKVSLMKHIEDNPEEDGYELIRKFIGYTDKRGKAQNEYILKKIRNHNSSDYCRDLIEKYYPYFPVWVFIELISFGDLSYLIAFYDSLYSDSIANNKFMNTVRDIRNAAAHSNCLLNKLFEPLNPGQQIDSTISTYVKSVKSISPNTRAKNLNYRVIYNFIILLYTYDTIVPDGEVKRHRHEELKDLFNNRMSKHKEYFHSNNKIIGVYNFTKNIVDNLS